VMVDNAIAFSILTSPPLKCAPLDVRQSTNKVLCDYSRQYEIIGESISRDSDVLVPSGRHRHGGRRLHGDMQR
jgi:hypothetical protein